MASDLPVASSDDKALSEVEVKRTCTCKWSANKIDALDFITTDKLYSDKADDEGIATAAFLLEHSELIKIVEKRREDLQRAANDVPIKTTMFCNWAGNLDISNGLLIYCQPSTVEQVIHIIKAVNSLKNIKVGFGGAYHSWSPLFPEKCSENHTGLLMNMTKLKLQSSQKRIRLNESSKYAKQLSFPFTTNTGKTVTIAPGVTTGELMKVFLEEGVCFKSDAVFMALTYGGVMTTGCHGVGNDQPVVSDYITELKIVNHNGDLKTYPDDIPSTQNVKEFMNAVKINLGLFGAVVEMTVKVEDMSTVKVNTSYPTIGELLYGKNPSLRSLLCKHWSVHLMWFPYNSLIGSLGGLVEGMTLIHLWQPKLDEVWMRITDEVESFCEANIIEKLNQKVLDTISGVPVGKYANPKRLHLGLLTPAIFANAHDLVKKTNSPGETYEQIPFGIHYRFGINLEPVYVMEFGFPLNLKDDNDPLYKNLIEAMRYVVELSENYARKCIYDSEYSLSCLLELRVIGKSDCLLCPASKNIEPSTHTAYLEIVSITDTTNYHDFFKKVGEKWKTLGGLPQWSKLWSFLGEDMIRHIHERYGDSLTKYCDILKTVSQNEDGTLNEMFINSSMKKVLGL